MAAFNVSRLEIMKGFYCQVKILYSYVHKNAVFLLFGDVILISL